MEGESYQAGASRSGPSPSRGLSEGVRVERAGIVSDLRLTLFAGRGVAQGESEVSRWLAGNEPEVFGGGNSGGNAGLRRRDEQAQASGPSAGRLDWQLDELIDQFALTGSE